MRCFIFELVFEMFVNLAIEADGTFEEIVAAPG
jgi:hypothetical protein